MSDFPSLLTQIRHPRRSRSVSVGPQSAADAYETLAFREKRRRESISSMADRNPVIGERGRPEDLESNLGFTTSNSTPQRYLASAVLPTPTLSDGDLSRNTTAELYPPNLPDSGSSGSGSATPRTLNRRLSDDRRQYDREDREMFSKLEKPRVRYDVEVITKLIVYTGMTQGNRFRMSAAILTTHHRHRMDCRRRQPSSLRTHRTRARQAIRTRTRPMTISPSSHHEQITILYCLIRRA